MKLAEALILRADRQTRITQLQERLNRSARVQEGDQPHENPQELIAELEALTTELGQLIQRINRTNSATDFRGRTLSDALTDRDILRMKRSAYESLTYAATVRSDRYMRSELRLVSTINVADVQRQIDRLSRNYRELDAQIQATNWATDLIE